MNIKLFIEDNYDMHICPNMILRRCRTCCIFGTACAITVHTNMLIWQKATYLWRDLSKRCLLGFMNTWMSFLKTLNDKITRKKIFSFAKN